MTRRTSNQTLPATTRDVGSTTARPGPEAGLEAESSRRASAGRGAAWLVAGVGTGIEALGLLAMGALSGYGVVSGGASTTTRALTEAVVLVVLAVGVGILARSLLQHKSLAKTPTLVWNFMLLPVSFSLMTGGAPVWGGLTAVLAVATLGAALLLPSYDLDDAADDTVV